MLKFTYLVGREELKVICHNNRKEFISSATDNFFCRESKFKKFCFIVPVIIKERNEFGKNKSADCCHSNDLFGRSKAINPAKMIYDFYVRDYHLGAQHRRQTRLH